MFLHKPFSTKDAFAGKSKHLPPFPERVWWGFYQLAPHRLTQPHLAESSFSM
jgi:hypothetical protein